MPLHLNIMPTDFGYLKQIMSNSAQNSNNRSFNMLLNDRTILYALKHNNNRVQKKCISFLKPKY